MTALVRLSFAGGRSGACRNLLLVELGLVSRSLCTVQRSWSTPYPRSPCAPPHQSGCAPRVECLSKLAKHVLNGLQRRRRASSVSVASAAPRQRSIARRCLREQQLEALLSSLDLVTNRDVSPLVIERQGQRPSVRAFELEVDAVAALHGWSALELLGRSKHSARAQNRLYVFGFQLPRAAVRREQRHGHDRTFRTRVRSPTRRHEVWSGRPGKAALDSIPGGA